MLRESMFSPDEQVSLIVRLFYGLQGVEPNLELPADVGKLLNCIVLRKNA